MTVRRAIVQQRAQAINGGNWYGQWGDPSVIPPNSSTMTSAAGVVVNERSVVSLMAVFGCLRVLADAASFIDVHVYKKGPQGSLRQEVDVPDVIEDPYADISLRDGIVRQVTSLGLNGNLFKHIIDRDPQGNPTQIELLNPSALKVEMVQGMKTYRIGAVGKIIPAADIVHVPWMTLAGGVVGLNPIEIGTMGLGIAIASSEYAARYFAQGMHPTGILSVEKPLRPDDAERLQQQLAVNHGGLAQSHTPIVLDAKTKWESIALTPESSQLLQSRAFSRAEIAGFYGVPPYLIGDTTDKGGSYLHGVQEMLILFTMLSLQGYTTRLDEADTALLPPGYYARRNVSDFLKTNDQMLAMLLMALRNASIASPNELRPYVDLQPSDEPGADSLFAPLNSSMADWWKPGGPTPTAPGSDAAPDNSPTDPTSAATAGDSAPNGT